MTKKISKTNQKRIDKLNRDRKTLNDAADVLDNLDDVSGKLTHTANVLRNISDEFEAEIAEIRGEL